MSSPWLSVVIPVYNGERYLAAALDSVLAQADPGVEILVSDDGSSDCSPRVISEYAASGRIVALDGPRVRNWVTNSNRAIRRSHGQLVTFLHQDDLWLPGRVKALRDALSCSADRSLWIGPTRFIDAVGRFAGTLRLPFGGTDTEVAPVLFLERLLVQNFIGMPTPAFTRAAFDQVGGMDESMWYTADWDLWLKLGTISGVGLWPVATTAFRLHTQSQTMIGAATAQTMKAQIETVRARYLPRIANLAVRDAVDRASRFSSELNTTLATAIGSRSVRLRELLPSLAGLGLRGAYRFARDARIFERSVARLRIGLVARRDPR